MKVSALSLLIIGLFFSSARSAVMDIPPGTIQGIGTRNSGDPAWDNKFLLSIAGNKYFIRTDLENGREMLTIILTAYEKGLNVYGRMETSVTDGEGRKWILFLHTGTI